MGDMKGQVAVVTGGTRGIGLAICQRLINRGVTVAAGYATKHDHAREFADKYADYGVSIHHGNIGHNDDCVRVFGEVLDRHGHVDILVNNAGITIDKTPSRGTSPARSTPSTAACTCRDGNHEPFGQRRSPAGDPIT